ncbi:MAG TPA: hypothetical protein VII66_04860 [Gemmatimonadaceae bacterium]
MEKRQLTANDLRKLAEAVDGIRDEPAYVVWGTNGPEVQTNRPASEDVMFECMTKNENPDRAELRSIILDPPVVTSDGKLLADLAARADAMFWSEAAVEKFVIPYYVRFSTSQEVDRIRKAFSHASVVALIHLPDSTSLVLTSVRTGRAMEILTLQEFESSL